MLVINRAVRLGRFDALRTASGSASGLLVWGVTAALGVGALLSASANAFFALRLMGATYLVYLGARYILGSRAKNDREIPHNSSLDRRSAYKQGLLTNLMNPKAGVFFTALLPQFVSSGRWATVVFLIYAVVASVASFLGLAIYAQLATHARHLFARQRVRRIFDRVTGTILIALGIRLLFTHRAT